jgi:hypothetical protein
MTSSLRSASISHFDVLLTFDLRDISALRELMEALEQRGISPLVINLKSQALASFIVRIPVVAVLVGRAGLGPWQAAEARSLFEVVARQNLQLIPVLLPGAWPEKELPFQNPRTWIDLRDGLTAQGIASLARAIRKKKSDRPERGEQASSRGRNLFEELGAHYLEPIVTGSPSDGIPATADGPAPLEAAEILLLAFLLVAARRASPDLLLHLDAAVLREAAAGVLDEGDLAPSPDPLRAAAEVLARRLPAAKPDPLWRSWMLATQGKALQDLAAALAAPSAARLPA